jgi:hypothetical protein
VSEFEILCRHSWLCRRLRIARRVLGGIKGGPLTQAGKTRIPKTAAKARWK